jgi:DNA-binding LytR/AlgR family response regulator
LAIDARGPVLSAAMTRYSRTPLRELLAALDPEAFWRIHRSVIVRAATIHRIELDAEGKYSCASRVGILLFIGVMT